LKIGFIGAGKVGFSLGKYFSISNISLSGYYSRSFDSSKQAAEFTYSKAYENIQDFLNDTDIIFITTPDDIVLNVWNEISKFKLDNKFICHCSGSLSSKIFSNLNNSGAFGYSIHPIYAFSDRYNSYKSLNEAFFSIEGNNEHIDVIKNIFITLKNKYIVITADTKPLYHLASVTVSNLVLSLIHAGCEELVSCGIDQEDALKALLPLIENNIKNLSKNGLINALTGPVERGDLNTIRHHMEVVPYEFKDTYRELSINLLKLSEKKHSTRDYSALKQYLNKI
jgi:predicted short-subunit dehydrogenase-like oxidoreductase (DUF2520 family)